LADSTPFKPHDAELDRGDILANVPLVRWKEGTARQGSPGRGVITSNECTCEDYERAVQRGSSAASRVLIQVAPLQSASRFPEDIQEEIKLGQRLDLFYVHGDGKALDDQVANLMREQPVPAEVLMRCTKIARLADWQWDALLVHIAVSRFHLKPEELFRPEILRGASDGS
jgi:hypothetical protein